MRVTPKILVMFYLLIILSNLRLRVNSPTWYFVCNRPYLSKNPNNKYQNPTEQIDVEKKDRLKIIKGLKE
ncbi:MAG: hypothetical protein CM15mP53_08570 [Ectothiorhodospiraceae bacterium]|nr:MAG: hypothetical protein CM15mP53_08570 [Ectothiorhodospiraceae bacterium]